MSGILGTEQFGQSFTEDSADPLGPGFTDIHGWFLYKGSSAQILQSNGIITFINENGGVSQGYFGSTSQVVASAWGNLVGNIVGLQIQWANGSTWNFVPDLTMTGTINGNLPVLVQQMGTNLKLTNERGGMSTGHFVSSTQFVADNWGGLTGTLIGNQISWGNGSVWTASDPALGTPVNVSGAWEIGGSNTTILQYGTSLVFVNERGQAAQGTVVDATNVVATGWGNLAGTIDPSGRRILWSNGSVWDRIPVLDHNEVWTTPSGRPAAISQMGVSILFTNENGQRSDGVFNPLTGVTATTWSISGTINFVDGQIDWNNGQVWTKSSFGARNAVFSDINNWPWLV